MRGREEANKRGSHGEAPEGDYEFCLALSHHVHHRLSVYHAFMEFVLGIAFSERQQHVHDEENRGEELFTVALSTKADDTRGNVGQPQQSCCVLGMLRVGKETTQALQHLIALYVGIPMGDDLQTLCRASDHLAAYRTKDLATAIDVLWRRRSKLVRRRMNALLPQL